MSSNDDNGPEILPADSPDQDQSEVVGGEASAPTSAPEPEPGRAVEGTSSEARSPSADTDADEGSRSADEGQAPAAAFIEKWKTSSIPFLNKPFFKGVQLALVLGGAAVLVNNYFVPKEVRDGIEVTTFTDSFGRGDLTDINGQSVGKLRADYPGGQEWVQFSGGFGAASEFEDVFGVSQDQASLFRASKGKGATFALVRGFVPPTTVEVRIAVPGTDAGLFFRYVDEENWWALVNEPLEGQFKIIRTLRGKSELVGTTGKNSILGSGYLLTVRLDPKGFEIFQNGSPVLRVDDSSLASRDAAGAGMFALSPRAVGARWDDFVMREPPAAPANVTPGDIDTDAVTPSTFVVPDSPIPQIPSGPSGAAGASGASGSSGPTGVSGVSGPSGESSPDSAASDASGASGP